MLQSKSPEADGTGKIIATSSEQLGDYQTANDQLRREQECRLGKTTTSSAPSHTFLAVRLQRAFALIPSRKRGIHVRKRIHGPAANGSGRLSVGFCSDVNISRSFAISVQIAFLSVDLDSSKSSGASASFSHFPASRSSSPSFALGFWLHSSTPGFRSFWRKLRGVPIGDIMAQARSLFRSIVVNPDALSGSPLDFLCQILNVTRTALRPRAAVATVVAAVSRSKTRGVSAGGIWASLGSDGDAQVQRVPHDL
jgi:hypothetical protein